MQLPNTLIVGAQKSGTTWLHHSLRKSDAVFASTPKELNFFNGNYPDKSLSDYAAQFSDCHQEIRLESSPNYFWDTGANSAANNIKRIIPQARIIISLRNPVDRYLSAYTHHIQASRLNYTTVIDQVVDDYHMISIGMYADILAHWLELFPDAHIILYDQIASNKVGVMRNLETFLGVTLGLTVRELRFRVNDASKKAKRKNVPQHLKDQWTGRPVLSEDARSRLKDIYKDQIEKLSDMIDLDFSAWKT